MDKKAKTLVLIISFALIGGAAQAGDFSGRQPTGWNTFEASWWVGFRVESPNGSTIGQITDFVIDQTNGRIALVLLSDVPGAGNRLVPVPYSAIVKRGESTFELSYEGVMGNDLVGSGPSYRYRDPYITGMERLPDDLYGIGSTSDPSWVAGAYRQFGQESYWTQKGQIPLAEMQLFEGSRLMGAEIRAPGAKEVARVDDFVIDGSDGHLAYVVLSDVSGRGDALVAVPFSTLTASAGNVFVLNATEDQLQAAPVFDSYAAADNFIWVESVYRHFGLQPYWTEEETP